MEDAYIRECISRAEAIVRDVDEPYRVAAFQAILRRFLAGDVVAAQPAAGPRGSTALPSTVSEFLAGAAPRNHVETVVLVAYHMCRSGDPAGMTIDELVAAYAQARLKKPSNPSDTLAKAIRKGYLIDAPQRKDGKKAWVITQTGDSFVEGRQVQARRGSA